MGGTGMEANASGSKRILECAEEAKSPHRILVRSLLKSRNTLRAKYRELRAECKRWRNQAAAVEKSRAAWRQRAEARAAAPGEQAERAALEAQLQGPRASARTRSRVGGLRPNKPSRRGPKKGGVEPTGGPEPRAGSGDVGPFGRRAPGQFVGPHHRACGPRRRLSNPSPRCWCGLPRLPRSSSPPRFPHPVHSIGTVSRGRALAGRVHRPGGAAGHDGQAVDPIGPPGLGRRVRLS